MLRSDRGEISLPGLLVAILIFGFVLTATYAAYDTFNRNVRDNQYRVEATDRARNASDTMARQMRNLATPTELQPNAVALASDYDIVFETVDPNGTPTAANPQNVGFVRYCLDGALRLWTMELPPASITASTVPPTNTACAGGGGWSDAKVVAQNIVNRYNGASRPVFSFDSAVNNQIRRIGVDLYVDTDPGTGPKEQQVTSGVDLRNQDRGPTAKFSLTLQGTNVIVLDASGSTDPDNDPLSFCWYDSLATSQVGSCNTKSVGDAQYFKYTAPPGTHTISLTVKDPSGLPSTYTWPNPVTTTG